MPNEFVARNGIIALNNSIITGSLNVTQGVTASLFGTASWANNATTASYVLNAVSASYALSASQAQNAVTASYVLNAVSASYALTSSNVQGGLSRYIPVWSTNTKLTSSVIYQNIDGYIGIGVTDPEAELEITNIFSIRNPALSAAKARFYWGNEFQTFNIDAYNSGTPWPFSIQSNGGNVGIGTSYPNFTLDVIGNGRYTSGLTVTGSLIAPSITGSLLGTASWATNTITASYILNAVSASYALSASNAQTASYILNAVSSSFAATASSADTFTVRGTLTAQTLVVQTVTSSIDFVTGSTRFGSTLSNTHQFTGSVGVTGSLTVNNNVLSVGGTSVGVGTAAPQTILHAGGSTTSEISVGTTNYGGSNNQALASIQSDQSSGTSGGILYIKTNPWNNSSGLGLYSPITRMTINELGNVGIGLTNPTARLHITASTGGVLEVDGTGTAGANALYVSASGNIGIGTATPTRALHIARTAAIGPSINLQTTDSTSNGSIAFSNSTNTALVQIGSNLNISDGNGGLEFLTNGTNTRMFISSSGNVGIGINSPGAKLEIAYTTNPTTATPHIILSTGGTVKQAAITAESSTISGLVFSTGDGTLTDRMTILRTNGNVGIGTTTPTYKLDIVGGFRIDGKSALTDNAYFVGSSTYGYRFNNNADTLNNVIMYDNGNVYIRGSLGIGTTSPLSPLHVVGSFRSVLTSLAGGDTLISAINGVSNGYRIQVDTSNNITYTWSTGTNTTAMYISSSGNVGIGTTTPTEKLSVIGNIDSTSTGTKIGFNVADSFTSYGTSTAQYGVSWGRDTNPVKLSGYYGLGLFTNGTERLTILQTGNVGIGTTAPVNEFEIFGGNQPRLSIRTTESILESLELGFQFGTGANASANTLALIRAVPTQVDPNPLIADLAFSTNAGDSNTEKMRITGAGNVGIGTASPGSYLLNVAGNISLSGAAQYIDFQNGDLRLVNAGGLFSLQTYSVSTGLTTKMTVTGLGNVGIGTTSPNARLDVSGSAIVSGSFTVSPSNAVELQVTSTGVNLGNISTDIHSVTGSLRVNGSITGSLFGTASYATQALSASWAPGGGGGSAPTAVTFNRVTGSYTFVLTDAGKTIEVSGSTATSHSLTIPASSSVDFADGTYIDVILYGTGSILFATASGVTIRSANSWNRIGTRYGAATLVNISGNEWYLIGNINP